MVSIRFSSALLSVTKENVKEIDLEEGTIKEVFDALIAEYGSDFEKRLFKDGNLNRFVNVFLNGEDIRYLSGLDTEVKGSDEISILPAVSGGCR